ncbi:hypothetical protein [Streptomyces doebereineriae]|uniref:Uncharacterized protein n=1 Tax=Streptomyces doebereineriae TaxID=3075528 RepID=A0ABU2V8L2_9ACTN|nr:hypothetical protein [Streptomyces sp. DSM 41640]MDT0481907.1 hypothetical protein [Streptomyces sp. DSM 41640]
MNERSASVVTATADGPSADRVRELLGLFGAPDVCAAEVLCDRHPADAVVQGLGKDLTATDPTHG